MTTPTLDERLAQFENMAAADPENDRAHFSLGSAQAGRAAEAARSLLRCLGINPEISKAYQLAGDALITAGWTDQGTKVINELRLDFSRDEDQHTFDMHMCEYLGIDAALYEELTSRG